MVNSTNADGDILWQDEAKCATVDTEEFFKTSAARDAKRFCAACPVQGDCLEYALVYDTYGIWGGMSRAERHRKYSSTRREMLREDLKESGLYNASLKL